MKPLRWAGAAEARRVAAIPPPAAAARRLRKRRLFIESFQPAWTNGAGDPFASPWSALPLTGKRASLFNQLRNGLRVAIFHRLQMLAVERQLAFVLENLV